MLSPQAEKLGDASPRPPPIDARACSAMVVSNNKNSVTVCVTLAFNSFV